MKFTNLGRQARTVTLNDLKLGDCFLFDNRIGMVASRNGHDFPLDLSTGKEFYAVSPAREWIPHDRPTMLAPSAEVIKISAELVYKILD